MSNTKNIDSVFHVNWKYVLVFVSFILTSTAISHGYELYFKVKLFSSIIFVRSIRWKTSVWNWFAFAFIIAFITYFIVHTQFQIFCCIKSNSSMITVNSSMVWFSLTFLQRRNTNKKIKILGVCESILCYSSELIWKIVDISFLKANTKQSFPW